MADPVVEPVVEPIVEPVVEPVIDKGDPPKTVPYERMVELNERMKAAEALNKKNAADQESVRVATMAEQGKHKELAEEKAAENVILKRENEEYKAERDTRHSALLEKLPETNQEFAKKHGLGLNALQDYSEQVLKTSGVKNHDDPSPDSPGGYQKPDKPFYDWSKAEKKEWAANIDKKRAAQ